MTNLITDCVRWKKISEGVRKVDRTKPGLSLIGNNQPGAALATVYAELGDEPQLRTSWTMKRINIALMRIIPEMILDQHLHPNLSFGHAGIISDEAPVETKKTPTMNFRAGICGETDGEFIAFLVFFSLWENS